MNRQRGFTLIELLVAMGIAALIAVLAYQAIDQVVRLKVQTQARQDALRAQQRALWKLEQDVLQMVPQVVRGPYGDAQAAMVLEEGAWRFSRMQLAPSPHGTAGIARVGYRLIDGALVREVWPVLNPAPDVRPHRQRLLDGVSAFEVWLWAAPGAPPQQIWPPLDVEGRPRLEALPVAVRVRLRLEDGATLERWWMGVS